MLEHLDHRRQLTLRRSVLTKFTVSYIEKSQREKHARSDDLPRFALLRAAEWSDWRALAAVL